MEFVRFCVGAHAAVAEQDMQRPLVDAALTDSRAARISEGLKATLAFLEVMTLRHADLNVENAKAVFRSGVSAEALRDPIAVSAFFNTVTRYGEALDFALPTTKEFERAANILRKAAVA